MIYLNEVFKNYEEFKELFGVVEHGNGVKSRKNKILLSLIKSRKVLKYQIEDEGSWYSIKSMTELKNSAMIVLRNSLQGGCFLYLNGMKYRNNFYYTDDFKGICRDGDVNCIRYINAETGKPYKMKAGKLFTKLMNSCPLGDLLPEQVKIWLAEEFAADWRAYASQFTGEYTLCVDDTEEAFERIYSSRYLKGCFNSCMVNKGLHYFYTNSVKAKAAWLEDEEGQIVARCVIFTEVNDEETGGCLRLAERQYSTEGDLDLQRQLILRLIDADEIDGYKRIGAGCGDAHAFVKNDGTPFESTDFSICCWLEHGEDLSYQDSFKYYDMSDNVAYNDEYKHWDYRLDTTNGELEEDHSDEVYSEYHDEWIHEDRATYVESRSDYFYNDEVFYCENTGSDEFREDCVVLANGDFAYYGRDCEGYHGVGYCPICETYFLSDYGYYSELTEEDYCCESCMEEAEQEYKERYWEYSDYDEEYFEEVVKVFYWEDNTFKRITISDESLTDLIEDGKAIEFEGEYYIDDLFEDVDEIFPVHIGCLVHI